MTLTEFITARLDEDEAWAREQGADAMVGWRWKGYPEDAYNEIQSRVLRQCARVLADVEAKRRIVERCAQAADVFVSEFSDDTAPILADEILALLALPYADHESYDERWRP